jgi:hypothetical protein
MTDIRLADAAIAEHRGVVGIARILSSCTSTWTAFGW